MSGKLPAAIPEARTAVLEELKLAVEFAEQEQSPELQSGRPSRPAPVFPAQLEQSQLITIPPNGLCLCHGCIAAFIPGSGGMSMERTATG